MPAVRSPERWQYVGVDAAGCRIYVRLSTPPGDAMGSMSKAELQELAAARGLAKSGSKADLIERLKS